jgi:hypothetical protein
MHSYVLAPRCFRLLSLLALIASIASLLSLTPQARAEQDHPVYLPIVIGPSASTLQPPTPNGPPEQQALDRLNYYRTLAGALLLQLHPALVTSSQNHANYYLLNYPDSSAWAYGRHGEVVGKPGYTGQWPSDRVKLTGYPWSGGWEVINFEDEPIRSVEGLIATVFHRVGMLDPYMEYMGYGHGRDSARPGTMAWVDVMDFGHGMSEITNRKQVVVFPTAGQANVPVEGAGESPSPLPPGGDFPIGYPITLQPIYSVPLIITQAELRDSKGALVAVYPSPSSCGTTCYALIPVDPLQKATTYTVHVVGAVDGDSFEKTWMFTTTANEAASFARSMLDQRASTNGS